MFTACKLIELIVSVPKTPYTGFPHPPLPASLETKDFTLMFLAVTINFYVID